MQLACVSAFGRWATLLLSSVLAKLQGRVRAFMVWLVSAGPMPTHIAFIMDGNRRFADRLHVDRRIGHSHGYDALLGTLKDCFELHVKIVSLFAFSIDNFQRSLDEVSALMDLMQSKLEMLVEKQGLASEYGIRVQVIGDLHLLPEGARMAAQKAMAVTRHNSSLVLNLCISYTSTQEIVRSIQQTRDNFLAPWSVSREQFGHPLHNIVDSCANVPCKNGVTNGDNAFENGFHIMRGEKGGYDELMVCEYNHASNGCNRVNDDDRFSDVNSKELVNGNLFVKSDDQMSLRERMVAEYVSEEEIEKNLYTYPCPPPDLLIRTSGETRLSNFLLWQTSFSHLAFCKVLWPEFSFWQLFFVILEYQRAFPSLLKKRQYYNSESWRHH